jgi:hypothetical protein
MDDLQIVNSFDAVTLISDGTNWFLMSKFQGVNMTQGLALIGGNPVGPSNLVEMLDLAVLSNTTNFGTLTVARGALASFASSVRAVWSGGDTSNNAANAPTNVIDYMTFATGGAAASFGNLTVSRNYCMGTSNQIMGLTAGAYNAAARSNVIDYVIISTTGNAVDFGDLTVVNAFSGSGCSSQTRALFAGGDGGVSTNIEYVSYATTGNATNFGALSVSRANLTGCSSATRGIWGGGNIGASPSNVIDYVTIATVAAAADFGDLTISRFSQSSASSKIRGVFAGGYDGSLFHNTIDYVTIATLGNAQDFGDLSVAKNNTGSCSNVHGGI